MSGLFEDDKNVRRVVSAPKQKPVQSVQAPVTSVAKNIKPISESKTAKSILDKLESGSGKSIASAASNHGGYDFSKVDLQKVEKKAKTAAKSADDKIVPAIDYIGE